MDPTIQWLLLGTALFVILMIALRRLSQIPVAQARALLESGALVLDVRSPEEFAARHVEGAINLPLEQIRRRIANIEPDRSRHLLIYCHTGSRSSIARRILRGLGYTEVHNLGSFGRARSIVKSISH